MILKFIKVWVFMGIGIFLLTSTMHSRTNQRGAEAQEAWKRLKSVNTIQKIKMNRVGKEVKIQMESIRKVLETAQIGDEVSIQLKWKNRKPVDLGTYKPQAQRGQSNLYRFNTIPRSCPVAATPIHLPNPKGPATTAAPQKRLPNARGEATLIIFNKTQNQKVELKIKQVAWE